MKRREIVDRKSDRSLSKSVLFEALVAKQVRRNTGIADKAVVEANRIERALVKKLEAKKPFGRISANWNRVNLWYDVDYLLTQEDRDEIERWKALNKRVQDHPIDPGVVAGLIRGRANGMRRMARLDSILEEHGRDLERLLRILDFK
jgi:hypothetical protein